MTEEEYLELVYGFADLVSKEMKKGEEYSKDEAELGNLARQMPVLISLVNTIGYLRGQDGAFLDFRPHTSKQEELYAMEHRFEERLNNLISVLMDSDQKEFYLKRLNSYFVKVRSGQYGDVW